MYYVSLKNAVFTLTYVSDLSVKTYSGHRTYRKPTDQNRLFLSISSM